MRQVAIKFIGATHASLPRDPPPAVPNLLAATAGAATAAAATAAAATTATAVTQPNEFNYSAEKPVVIGWAMTVSSETDHNMKNLPWM